MIGCLLPFIGLLTFSTRHIEDIKTFYRIATCKLPFISNQGKLTKRALFDIQKIGKYNACCCIELNNNTLTPLHSPPHALGVVFFFPFLSWTGQKSCFIFDEPGLDARRKCANTTQPTYTAHYMNICRLVIYQSTWRSSGCPWFEFWIRYFFSIWATILSSCTCCLPLCVGSLLDHSWVKKKKKSMILTISFLPTEIDLDRFP